MCKDYKRIFVNKPELRCYLLRIPTNLIRVLIPIRILPQIMCKRFGTTYICRLKFTAGIQVYCTDRPTLYTTLYTVQKIIFDRLMKVSIDFCFKIRTV